MNINDNDYMNKLTILSINNYNRNIFDKTSQGTFMVKLHFNFVRKHKLKSINHSVFILNKYILQCWYYSVETIIPLAKFIEFAHCSAENKSIEDNTLSIFTEWKILSS